MRLCERIQHATGRLVQDRYADRADGVESEFVCVRQRDAIQRRRDLPGDRFVRRDCRGGQKAIVGAGAVLRVNVKSIVRASTVGFGLVVKLGSVQPRFETIVGAGAVRFQLATRA